MTCPCSLGREVCNCVVDSPPERREVTEAGVILALFWWAVVFVLVAVIAAVLG